MEWGLLLPVVGWAAVLGGIAGFFVSRPDTDSDGWVVVPIGILFFAAAAAVGVLVLALAIKVLLGFFVWMGVMIGGTIGA